MPACTGLLVTDHLLLGPADRPLGFYAEGKGRQVYVSSQGQSVA
jgi:hypothetical protein